MGILIVIGIIVLLILMIVGVYNAIIMLENRVQNAWGQIEVQLKKRHDLVPNLVETVKGY
ncbi:MAG TPA: LemA family protein, partial [bacterium]|nr:LemA family protein [bacterium]